MDSLLSYKDFSTKLEEFGFIVPNNQILIQFYLFYTFYKSPSNEGVSAIVIEGLTGTGKTFFGEVFTKILGKDAKLMYRQCIDETGKEEMFMDYDAKAMLLGDADKIIVDGILIEAIKEANKGIKVVLMIDELDKARPRLDGYFLDFARSGRVVVSGKEIYQLTAEGRKNLYFIMGKNDQRELSKELQRRAKYAVLPPLPPTKVQEQLNKKFKNNHHDEKFLILITKIYSLLYKAYNDGKIERPPAIQEIVQTINSDSELFDNNLSITDRLRNMISELIKNDEDRKFLEDLLIDQFHYKNSESAYEVEQDKEDAKIDTDNINDFLNNVESGNSNSNVGDGTRDKLDSISDILDNITSDDRQFLSFGNGDNEVYELGRIMCDSTQITKALFDIIRNESDPSSSFGVLHNEGSVFIGVAFIKNAIILFANSDKLSPTLVVGALSKLYSILQPLDNDNLMRYVNNGFQMTARTPLYMRYFNAKILSTLPQVLVDMCDENDGQYSLETDDISLKFDLESLEDRYVQYNQNIGKVELKRFIYELLLSNPELGTLASLLTYGEPFKENDEQYQKAIAGYNPESIIKFCTDVAGRYEISNGDWYVKGPNGSVLFDKSIFQTGKIIEDIGDIFIPRNNYIMRHHPDIINYYTPMMHSKNKAKVKVKV